MYTCAYVKFSENHYFLSVDTAICVAYQQVSNVSFSENFARDHAFSTCENFSEKLTFLTPWCAPVRVRIRGEEMVALRGILRTYQMNYPLSIMWFHFSWNKRETNSIVIFIAIFYVEAERSVKLSTNEKSRYCEIMKLNTHKISRV